MKYSRAGRVNIGSVQPTRTPAVATKMTNAPSAVLLSLEESTTAATSTTTTNSAKIPLITAMVIRAQLRPANARQAPTM